MRSLLVLVTACVLCQCCLASEADVHYGLTHWLARKAGFSAADADLIAKADLEKDTGKVNPATWEVFHILLSGEAEAAENVRRDHFPSDATMPSWAVARAVSPDSNAAERLLENILSDDSEIAKARWLKDIGYALHPFQDSWSHQGVPDTPFNPFVPIYPKLTWGHPCDRGGWYSHNADLTYLHAAEVLSMAERTYYFLGLLLEYPPVFSGNQLISVRDHPGAKWNAIKDKVVEFAQASTIEAKYSWFNSYSDIPFSEYSQADFLDSLSLRNTPQHGLAPVSQPCFRPDSASLPWPVTFVRWMKSFFQRAHLSAAEETAVTKLLKQFFAEWLEKQDFDAALKSLTLTGFNSKKPLSPEAEKARLQTLLLYDHGQANELQHGEYFGDTGHGVFQTSFPPAQPPSGMEQLKFVHFDSVEDAIEAPDFAGSGPPMTYRLIPVRGSLKRQFVRNGYKTPIYIAAFKFKRLPNDLLFLVLTKPSNQWKITELHSLAF